MNAQQQPFRELYLANFDFVWGALRRLGVREHDAQDLTQKVFLVVYLKLPQFENRSSLRTWIFRICINAASDYRRSAPIRREVVTEPAEMAHLSGFQDDLHERSEAQRRLALAEAIVEKLPESQRLVFILFELEEMSGVEIAKLLGISLGTVRSRLRLAREVFTREAKRIIVHEEAPRKQALR
ncbi:MAG TPA: sigma-70 family RNA polymerase sigma factor [Polyangiaceae bacterium]|jgi:RNA polymerase sigma-70 factor (ECF subfamily)|nr:sigma-70 family RNA polymerase sigma factor [Polyangiaceae bacterium]